MNCRARHWQRQAGPETRRDIDRDAGRLAAIDVTVTQASHERESESRPSHWRLAHGTDSTASHGATLSRCTVLPVALPGGLLGPSFVFSFSYCAPGATAGEPEYCGSPGSLAVAAFNQAGI